MKLYIVRLVNIRNMTTITQIPEGQFRTERDSFGDISVPANKYYGANTARSLIHFNIGGPTEKMPVKLAILIMRINNVIKFVFTSCQ
jgi:hypothetical protein